MLKTSYYGFLPSVLDMHVHTFASIHIHLFIVNNIHTCTRLKYRSPKTLQHSTWAEKYKR